MLVRNELNANWKLFVSFHFNNHFCSDYLMYKPENAHWIKHFHSNVVMHHVHRTLNLNLRWFHFNICSYRLVMRSRLWWTLLDFHYSLVFLWVLVQILFCSSRQISPFRCLTDFRTSTTPWGRPAPHSPSVALIFNPPPSPSQDPPAHWTLVWELCPNSCPNWDRWRTPISPPSFLHPPPLSAPSPLLTRCTLPLPFLPPSLPSLSPPLPSLPPLLRVPVKPTRVEAFPSTTFAPSSDLRGPAPGLCLHLPETSMTVQLGLTTPSTARLLSPLRTSTTSLPSPAAPVTGLGLGPSQAQTPDGRPQQEPQLDSVVSQNPSLLCSPCIHCPWGPQVLQLLIKGPDCALFGF